MKYMVFWIKNRRMGSVELTPDNIDLAHRMMRVSLIQVDDSGTEHYEIHGLLSFGRQQMRREKWTRLAADHAKTTPTAC